MPFPLPLDAATSALRYYLVAVPDRTEYRQAALGAYTEFTKYWLWGHEGPEPGSHDAAAAWELAVARTLELLEMDWPEQVLLHIDELEDLLRQIALNDLGDPPCCGNLDGEDEVIPPPGFEPGVGTPPDYYGDWPISDWDDYYDRLCANAHAYLLLLVLNTRKLASLVAAGTAAITLVASILGVLSGAGILLKIAYTTAAALVGGLVNVSATALLNEAADDLETEAEKVFCAIFHNYPPLASVIEEIVSPAAWSLFFQWVNWGNATNVLLSGGTGSQSLPDRSLPGDCDSCAPPQTLTWTFDTGDQGWKRYISGEEQPDSPWSGAEGNPPGSITSAGDTRFLHSPAFTLSEEATVRVVLDRRRATSGGNRVRRAIRRTSDNEVMWSVSNLVGGSQAWISEAHGWVTLPAGEYYLQLGSDSRLYWDNITVELAP